MKIRVGILDSDQVYMARLVRYFTTHYIDKIEISAFHSLESFTEFIRQTRIDVFLADPAFIPSDMEIPKTMIMAFLTDSEHAQKVGNVSAVYKYQQAENLYREILGLYAELDKMTTYKSAEGESAVICFMGAAGGTGTTTMAVACARSLASNGKKVLYLNLEENGVITPFIQGQGSTTMSDVLYVVKSNRTKLVLKLESMVRKSEQGVYFYEPFAIAPDAHEMTASDLQEILNTLIRYYDYDFIVLDTDTDVIWKRNLLLKYARHVMMVSDGRTVSNLKLNRILQEFAIRDANEEERNMAKTRILYNRQRDGKTVGDIDHKELIYDAVEEIRGSSEENIVQKIAATPIFDRLL